MLFATRRSGSTIVARTLGRASHAAPHARSRPSAARRAGSAAAPASAYLRRLCGLFTAPLLAELNAALEGATDERAAAPGAPPAAGAVRGRAAPAVDPAGPATAEKEGKPAPTTQEFGRVSHQRYFALGQTQGGFVVTNL